MQHGNIYFMHLLNGCCCVSDVINKNVMPKWTTLIERWKSHVNHKPFIVHYLIIGMLKFVYDISSWSLSRSFLNTS